jgi:hypothetical protein
VNYSQINAGAIMTIKHLLSLTRGSKLTIIKKMPRYCVWMVMINGTPFAIDSKLGEEYVSKVKHKKV